MDRAYQGQNDRAEHVARVLEGGEAGDTRIYVSAITDTEITKGANAADPELSEEQQQTFDKFLEVPYVTVVAADPIITRRAQTCGGRIPACGLPTR